MTNTEKTERLKQAIAHILEVEENLSDASHQCEACGLTVRENYTEARIRENLAAVRNRLSRVIGSIHSWH